LLLVLLWLGLDSRPLALSLAGPVQNGGSITFGMPLTREYGSFCGHVALLVA
jgi:hypothetical protein